MEDNPNYEERCWREVYKSKGILKHEQTPAKLLPTYIHDQGLLLSPRITRYTQEEDQEFQKNLNLTQPLRSESPLISTSVPRSSPSKSQTKRSINLSKSPYSQHTFTSKLRHELTLKERKSSNTVSKQPSVRSSYSSRYVSKYSREEDLKTLLKCVMKHMDSCRELREEIESMGGSEIIYEYINN
jgi:hypothetical protein